MLDKIKQILGVVAPGVATLFGGPAGGLVATQLLNILGLSPEASEDQILKSLQTATPEIFLKLKELEHNTQITLKTLDIDAAKVSQADTASARTRETEMAKAGIKDYTNPALAFIVTLGFFGILAVIVFVNIPAGATQVLDIMIGSLGAAWLTVIGYYFGSSSGSAAKNTILAKEISDIKK